MDGGHGWVTPRPDGLKARCGGPGMCSQCQREERALRSADIVERLRLNGSARNIEAAAEIEKLRLQLGTAISVLEMCQECIRGETPEDMTDEEAREYVISKIREVILPDELRTTPISGAESCTCHFIGDGRFHSSECPYHRSITTLTSAKGTSE